MAGQTRNGHESATFTAADRWPIYRARNRDPPVAQRKRHPGLLPVDAVSVSFPTTFPDR
jgi:hypothetical protein